MGPSPVVFLRSLHTKVKDAVSDAFDSAVEQGDSEAMISHFKQFPMIAQGIETKILLY